MIFPTNLLIAIAALLFFGFFDYCGYNLAVRRSKVWIYRIIQNVLQWLIMTPLLWWQFGFLTAFLFDWMWWCWMADMAYYWLYDTLKWFNEPGSEYAGKAFRTVVLGDKVVWSWWSLYGLFFRMLIPLLLRGRTDKNVPIPGHVLIAQAILGFVAAFLIAALCDWTPAKVIVMGIVGG